MNSDKKQRKGHSLPPRNTIHNIKEKQSKPKSQTNNKSDTNSVYILVASFLFILLLSSVIYYQFAGPSDISTNGSIEPSVSDQSDQHENSGEDNEGQEENDLAKPETETIPSTPEGETTDQSSDPNQTSEDTNSPVYNQDEKTHVVESGENLYRISLKYYSDGKYFNDIATYNGLSDSNDIYVGLKLKIPSIETLTNSN